MAAKRATAAALAFGALYLTLQLIFPPGTFALQLWAWVGLAGIFALTAFGLPLLLELEAENEPTGFRKIATVVREQIPLEVAILCFLGALITWTGATARSGNQALLTFGLAALGLVGAVMIILTTYLTRSSEGTTQAWDR